MTLQMERPEPSAQMGEVVSPTPEPSGFKPFDGGSGTECDFCDKDAVYRCQGHNIQLSTDEQKQFKTENPQCISKVCETHYQQYKSHGHNYQRI